jgi:hypothetical protein
MRSHGDTPTPLSLAMAAASASTPLSAKRAARAGAAVGPRFPAAATRLPSRRMSSFTWPPSTATPSTRRPKRAT